MENNQISLGLLVKHKTRKFVGNIDQIINNGRVLVMPIDSYVLSLYPYGIESNNDELDIVK